MALRSIEAPDGTRWQVWQVTPGRATRGERRVADRRSPDPVLLYRGPERRERDRRRGGAYPALIATSHAGGWLVFESPGEKRRLAPPPEGWEGCPEAVLLEYLERAIPTP